MAVTSVIQYLRTTREHTKYIQEELEEEKWVKQYSSNHEILLVGEGGFSFSLSPALSFASASNIVASSLDSYDEVIKKYKNGKSNLERLEKLGASHLHGVHVAHMKLHTDLSMRKFDRIIFNLISSRGLPCEHKELVHCFFANARVMLRAHGEIHVNHKTTPPFCCWNIEEIGNRNCLALVENVEFKIEDYPGYSNKRGDGSRCDVPFPSGKCSTFKFRFCPSANKSEVKEHECSRTHKVMEAIEFLTSPSTHMRFMDMRF